MFCEEVKEKFSIADFVYNLGNRENFYLLDSEGFCEGYSGYSYIGLTPTFSVFQVGEEVFYEKEGEVRRVNEPLFDLMRRLKSERREKGIFPFSGGFVGYITYDFGWLLDKFRPSKFPKKILNLCLAKFNWYDELFVFDHNENRLYFVCATKKSEWKKLLEYFKRAKLDDNNAKSLSNIRHSITKRHYINMIEKTKRYIKAGDIYQANITQRFSYPFLFEPTEFYNRLRRLSPAPFGAFLKEKGVTVICNSPERFIYKEGRYVETRPIKGTRKRAYDKTRDMKLIKELQNSEKDRAEHIMIVDLERNDLGKICETGTVKVSELMRVESYANVHHLVSIVSGILKDGKDVYDCILKTFPGGSITGAPKLRSMEIIDELEPVKRGIYCGSIGYIDASGDADLNIAIRTGVVTRKRLFFNVGGGIVADSDAYDEYDETITKAKSFLAALGLSEVAE